VSDFAPAQVETVGNSLPVFPPKGNADKSPQGAQTLAIAEGEGVSVPQLAGKSVRSVTEELLRLGLSPVLIGTGVAIQQNPEAGTAVRRGARITVRFARSASLVSVSGRGN